MGNEEQRFAHSELPAFPTAAMLMAIGAGAALGALSAGER